MRLSYFSAQERAIFLNFPTAIFLNFPTMTKNKTAPQTRGLLSRTNQQEAVQMRGRYKKTVT